MVEVDCVVVEDVAVPFVPLGILPLFIPESLVVVGMFMDGLVCGLVGIVEGEAPLTGPVPCAGIICCIPSVAAPELKDSVCPAPVVGAPSPPAGIGGVTAFFSID